MDAKGWRGEGPGGRFCPYSGMQCDDHLLAYIDRYGDDVGFIGGSVYGIARTGSEVLQRIRLAWLADAVVPPKWVASAPALLFYFERLGELPADQGSAPADADEEERSWEMTALAGHGELAREALQRLLEQSGWDGARSEWEFDEVPGLSTVYESWWALAPRVLVHRLDEALRRALAAADGART